MTKSLIINSIQIEIYVVINSLENVAVIHVVIHLKVLVFDIFEILTWLCSWGSQLKTHNIKIEKHNSKLTLQ